MPTSSVYANSVSDLNVYKTGASTYADAIGDSTTVGSFYSRTATNSSIGVYSREIPSRGGGTVFINGRSYFTFDLSSLSGTATSATARFYLDNWSAGASHNGQVIMVESRTYGLNVTSYPECYSATNILTGMGTLETTYSNATDVSTTAGYHDIACNAACLNDINSKIGTSTSLKICLMSAEFDYKSVNSGTVNNPSTTQYHRTLVYYANYTGTSRDPVLDITFEDGTDNAILFGTNF